MKRLLLFLVLLLPLVALGQPILRNSLTTNTLGTNLVWFPSTFEFRDSGADPFFRLYDTTGGVGGKAWGVQATSDQIQFRRYADDLSTSLLLGYFGTTGDFHITDYLSLTGATNRLSIANNQLMLDGVAVASTGNTTNVYNTTITTNLYATNIFTQTVNAETNIFNVAKGGHLTITNYVQFPWTVLSYASTSNITVNLTNSMFKLTLTNDAYFGVPTGLPGTNLAQTIQIALLQDGTGVRRVTMTNSAWVVSGSGASSNAVLNITTNANSLSVVTFVTSPFSPTVLYGVTTPFIP